MQICGLMPYSILSLKKVWLELNKLHFTMCKCLLILVVMDKIIACNWKANMGSESVSDFFYKLNTITLGAKLQNFIVFPPFIYAKMIDVTICNLGGQDVSKCNDGAYTGETTARMLKDIGATYSLVGHSERRVLFNEDDQVITQKLKNCILNDITPILCIGETQDQRQLGKVEEVLKKQLSVLDYIDASNIIIAYEPVWAIGTGLVASKKDIQNAHLYIKSIVDKKVIYGGSVNLDNCEDTLSIDEVDGVLVGGASLNANSVITMLKFAKIL